MGTNHVQSRTCVQKNGVRKKQQQQQQQQQCGYYTMFEKQTQPKQDYLLVTDGFCLFVFVCVPSPSRYPEAISAYNRALSVSSLSNRFTVLCALGFVYHCSHDLSAAIGYYHQALGLHPRDAFATDMLDRALNEMANDDVEEAMGNTTV